MIESSTYSISEIAGTSTESISAAMQNGVRKVAETVRNIDWVEVVHVRGHVEDGRIAHFQVQMKVGFRVEE